MGKIKFFFICVLGCIVLAAGFGILHFLWAVSPDQVLTYSTFLGGNRADYGRDIAVDSTGNAYVTGQTGSADFPFTRGYSYTGGNVTFVAKLDPIVSGNLIWCTLLGGGGQGLRIALDEAGDYIYVAGVTGSADFQTTDGSNVNIEDNSIYVAKFINDGTLVFSTVIGEGGFPSGVVNKGVGIAVNRENGSDFIYLTGVTKDPGFFAFHGTPLEEFAGGTSDGFVVKFNQGVDPATSPLQFIYGRFLGGTGNDRPGGIAVDASGNAYITGKTSSPDFPIFPIGNSFQNTINGQADAFVTKLNATGVVIYSTYLGGDESGGPGDEEQGFDIGVDTSDRVYVTGRVGSSDLLTKRAFDSTHNGDNDAFFAKLDPSQSGDASLLYATYLGGSSGERGTSIALDASGNAYVFGRTLSRNFLTTPDAFDPTYNGRHDNFLAKINPSQSGEASLVSSTYFGGKRDDGPGAIALYTNGMGQVSVYVCGSTASRDDFPIKPGAYDETYNGGQQDAFFSVLVFQEANELPVVTITNPADGSTFGSGILIDFAGTASDSEGSDLTAGLVWDSDIDGQIGIGGNFSTVLSDGVHTVTASVTDSGSKTGSDSISITVGTQPELNIVSIESVTYSTQGGKNRDKHLVITFTLLDNLGNAVAGASLSFDLYQYEDETMQILVSSYNYTTGTTGSDGTAKFSHKNAQWPGCYTSEVTNVTAEGLTWDDVTPANQFCK